ncbi:hypothetical protein ACOSP7_006890 [Xanthoceras sorbifolium]
MRWLQCEESRLGAASMEGAAAVATRGDERGGEFLFLNLFIAALGWCWLKAANRVTVVLVEGDEPSEDN